MTDIIAKHNHGFMGKGGKLLRIRKSSTIKNGLLYNWYTVVDNRNVTSAGWHVPSLAEWQTLRSYVDPAHSDIANDAGGYLKETMFTYWDSPNTDATNLTGFFGRGNGLRDQYGAFGQIKIQGTFLSSDALDEFNARAVLLSNSNAIFDCASFTPNKKSGLGIRLIKDDSTQVATYVGNDGKIYPTVKLGNQVWTTRNLSETKYRNGDGIPEVITWVTWETLTDGAWCAYNNDTNNI